MPGATPSGPTSSRPSTAPSPTSGAGAPSCSSSRTSTGPTSPPASSSPSFSPAAGPSGVGLLATYRSDDVHRRHPLTAALAVWSRLPGLTRVDLGPLPDAAVGRIVRRGGEALSPRVVDDLVRRAEGNAFFAEELAAAVRSGARDAEDLQRLLLARVDQLSEAAQGVVRVAAVVGRRVPHVLLERVAGVEPAVLRDALRAAVEHHVLEPWGDRGYEFRHALLAEAVLDDLLPHERLQLHRACADALLEDPALGSEADLARHALASGDRDLALTAAVRAGDSARRMGGPAEALAHYEAALGLLGRGPTGSSDDAHDAHALTLKAAAAANAAGRPMRAAALLRARLSTGDPTPYQRAALLGGVAFASRMTEERVDRLALTAEALDLLDDEAPVGLRVGVLTRRAEALMDADATAEALEVADEAMALAVEYDLSVDRTDLSSILARLSEVAGDPVESIRRLEGIVAEWRDVPDLALLRAMHVLAGVHYRQGQFEAALAGFERTVAEARRVGLASSVWGSDARSFAVTTAYEMGDWDRALLLADDAANCGLSSSALAGVEAAAAYVRAGRGTATADELLAASRPWWGEDGRIAVQAGSAAVEALGHDGDLDAMLALHGEVVSFLRDLWGVDRVAAEVRLAAVTLGRLAGALRGATPARRDALLARAHALADDASAVWGPGSSLPAPTLEGRAWDSRARAEWLRARWAGGDDVPPEQLTGAWRETVALFEERAEPYEVARSRLRLAEVLSASGDRGATELVGLVREAARALRARPLLVELDRVAAPAVADHRADRPGVGGARPPRPGPLQRRDRADPLHQHEDGERARVEHPRQARGRLARGGRGRRPGRGTARRLAGSAARVARVAAGLALVAAPVVAGDPGHEFLRVTALDVVEEGGGPSAAQDGRPPAVVGDDDLGAAPGELEAGGGGHGAQRSRRARCPRVRATTSRVAPSMCATTSASGRPVKYCT